MISPICQITFTCTENTSDRTIDWLRSVFWQRPNKCKVICEETENSKYIMHSLGALDDSCFMAFPNEPGQYVSEQCLVQSLYSSQGGGPPTWSQWWSKYCCMATSPSIARRVNCGQAAGLCYLSLPPDHGGRGLRWRGWSRQPPFSVPLWIPHPLPSPSWSGSQLIVFNVSGLGWTWQSPTSFKQKTNRSRPSGAEGKLRPRGNEVPTDAPVTGWRPWFPSL